MTNAAPGLGWPAAPRAKSDAETAPLRGVGGAADAGSRAAAEVASSRPGHIPDRYARRAVRIGLGWPLDWTEAGPGPVEHPLGSVSAVGPEESLDATTPERVRQALAHVSRETRPETLMSQPGDGGVRGTGTTGVRAGSQAEDAPARAIAGGAAEAPSAAGGPGSADRSADQIGVGVGPPRTGPGGFGERTAESEENVVIPAMAGGSADTPIARAAQAAVVARSGGEMWPRPSLCRVITIANQKGGVGKTTTAVNVAAGLAMHGTRVLVIDLDPQGNASTALDVEHHSGIPSVYHVLVDDQALSSIVRPVRGYPHLYCAPATIDLAGAEIELVPLVARESRLARAVASYDASNLDYIFIDCPPSLGLLTVNALVAAPEVLIPIQCEYYALEGLEQLLRTVELVRSHLNPALSVTTILLTMYDARTRLASQVADEVRDHFGEVVLGSVIPRSVRVSEAPSYGQSVMTYDPGSTGALAYLEAARELAHRNVQAPAG